MLDDFAHGHRVARRDVDWSRHVALRDGHERARDVVHVEEVADLLPAGRRRRPAVEQRERHGRDESARVLVRARRDRRVAPRRDSVAVPSQMRASRSMVATFARAYGVIGPRGLDSASGASLGAYSKQVPRRDEPRAPCVDERPAELLGAATWTSFSGDVRYSPGSRDPGAVDAEFGRHAADELRNGRRDPSGRSTRVRSAGSSRSRGAPGSRTTPCTAHPCSTKRPRDARADEPCRARHQDRRDPSVLSD